MSAMSDEQIVAALDILAQLVTDKPKSYHRAGVTYFEDCPRCVYCDLSPYPEEEHAKDCPIILGQEFLEAIKVMDMSDKVRQFRISIPDWNDRMHDQLVKSCPIHCPDCGVKGGVWEYSDEHKTGVNYICIECCFVFYMSFGTDKHAKTIANTIKTKANL